ncbi:MAG: YfbM family protein [Dysgonomonas sp.]
MSMISNFLRVSQEELDSFLENSALLEDRFYNEGDDEDPCMLDIDKAWDGIIYLLTGKSIQGIDMSDQSGLHTVILSGQLIDPEQDMGYGPAHYLTPDQVQELSATISKETRESMLSRFKPADMHDVYPTIWEEEGEEAFDYVFANFQELQKFYAQAAKENQAVISILN